MTFKKNNYFRKTIIFTVLLIIPFFFLSRADSGIPVRKNDSNYLIAGQNSLQKIFYSSSSAFTATHEADKALDSDTDTIWLSKKSNKAQWVQIDFGIKRLMTKIVVIPGRKNNEATLKQVHLQFLHEDKWFTFKKHTLENSFFNSEEKIEFDLGGIDASIFRIYIPANSTFDGHAAISEIETYLGSHKIQFFDKRLQSLISPIQNGLLPDKESAYPNAPRGYRGGRHAGLDFYHYFDSTTYEKKTVNRKTPIIASEKGTIIRADWNYKSMTPKEWMKQSKYYQTHPRTFVKRSFGGIQIWIDHGDGIITAYNHLTKIQPGIKVGVPVKRGQLIGYAGNSGLYGDAVGNDWGIHLHYEIWVDGNYLGYGMEHKVIKRYLQWMFFQLQ